MRPRNTLLLLLVLAALGAYLYWVELPQQKTQAEQKRLLAFDKDDVSALGLEYPDHAIALEKQDGAWKIVKPLETGADAASVANLLTAVADAQVTRTLVDVGDKLASYGLDPPEATVTLTRKTGGALPPLKIGKTTQVGFSAYVQKGDDPKVYITGAALQSGMKKQLKDLRDKTLIAFDETEVKRIKLDRRGDAIVLERADDRWTVTEPKPYPADGSEVRAFLSSLRSLRADDFVTDDPQADLAPYRLVSPKLRITIWGKDDAMQSVFIGNPHEDPQKKMVYVKRAERPTVYTVPEYAVKNVDKDLATLRDKAVIAYEKEKAAKLVVTRKDGAGFTIARRDGAWHLDTPGEGVERAPTVTRFVDDVAGLKGSEIVNEVYPDYAKYGLADPDFSVAVSDASGAALGTLLAARVPAAPEGGEAKVYVAAAGGGIVYGVKPFVLDRIDKRLTDFREPPSTPRPTVAGAPTPAAEAPGLEPGDEGAGDDLGGEDDDLGEDGD